MSSRTEGIVGVTIVAMVVAGIIAVFNYGFEKQERQARQRCEAFFHLARTHADTLEVAKRYEGDYECVRVLP